MSAEKAGPDKADKADKAERAEKKKGQKGDGGAKAETAAQASARSAVKARLRERYAAEVVPALTKEFGYKNIMAVPRLTKVVVNMGLGEGTQNAKIVDTGAEELGKITGQKAAITRSTKSISQFKLRKNMAIGAMVTLRGERMFEFLDRLIAVALPRVRDFRGVSAKGFDGRGNYTLGLRDQLMFPEIDYLKVDKARGMNISVVTTAKTDEEARRLLQLLGMPFRQN
jgi:large subunit ribosomal protein L5